MNIWTIIRSFNYGQLWQLFLLVIKYPVYIYPTLKATVKTFQISKDKFPKTHGKNGRANAFRHALWNLLICLECNKWRKDKDRVAAWAKLITSKHEELSPNVPLDKMMDLHNNEIGVNLFVEFNFSNVKDIINKLNNELLNSVQIKSVDEVEMCKNKLVYITDI